MLAVSVKEAQMVTNRMTICCLTAIGDMRKSPCMLDTEPLNQRINGMAAIGPSLMR